MLAKSKLLTLIGWCLPPRPPGCPSSRAGSPGTPTLVVARRSELTVGVRVQACGSSFPRQRCVGWLSRAINARVSLRNHPGIVIAQVIWQRARRFHRSCSRPRWWTAPGFAMGQARQPGSDVPGTSFSLALLALSRASL
uniref:Uncharacterized protein n=1 Tax=Ixodes ricinus TaxID=34613 RepID=A0A6B0UU90_IXORI